MVRWRIQYFTPSMKSNGKWPCRKNALIKSQNQAFNAVLFPYRHVLHKELEESIQAVRAKRPQRLSRY